MNTFTGESGAAGAAVVVDAIDTGAPVVAGTPRYALVIAGLTVAAVKVRHAKTLPLGVFPRGVGHRAVHQTNPAVEAVVAVALPQENVARHTRPPCVDARFGYRGRQMGVCS